jgi:hypothetical protein
MKSAPPPLSVNVRFYPQQNQHIRDKTSKSCRKYVYSNYMAYSCGRYEAMQQEGPPHA